MQAETFAHQDEGADGARRGPANDLSGSGGRRGREGLRAVPWPRHRSSDGATPGAGAAEIGRDN